MKKIFTLIVMLTAALGMQAQDTWTVAGTEALCGSNWNVEDEANNMTSTDGKIYTWEKKDVAMKAGAKYEFKIVKNHSWNEEIYGGAAGGQESDNYELRVEENGKYTVNITFDSEAKKITAQTTKTGDAEFGDQSWTVAGAVALCGTSWDPTNTDNDMTSTDGVNYTFIKEGVVLEAGVNYEFKIVADHAWGEEYPSNNYVLTVEENGTYTVTITFNKDTKDITANAQKTGEAVIGDKTWTIAGVEALMGTNWDQTDTNNDMTNMGDGTFQLVKYNVAMEAEKEYEYKVVANHSWDENYGSETGGNMTVSVETAGNYDVTFVWNPESKELYATTEVANPAAISTVKTNAVVSVIYNLQGQRVQNNYRGIVIKNGRKVMVK